MALVKNPGSRRSDSVPMKLSSRLTLKTMETQSHLQIKKLKKLLERFCNMFWII